MVTSLVFKAKNESVNKKKNLETLTQRNEMIQFEKSLQNFDKSFYTQKPGGGAFTSQKLQKTCFAISKRFFLDPKYKSVLV